jgi:hypothetical protein
MPKEPSVNWPCRYRLDFIMKSNMSQRDFQLVRCKESAWAIESSVMLRCKNIGGGSFLMARLTKRVNHS